MRKLASLMIVGIAIAATILLEDDGALLVAGGLICALVIALVSLGLGSLVLERHPVAGGWLLEASTLIRWLAGAAASTALLWAAIELGPGDDASTEAKELWAAGSAALGAFITAWLVEPEGEDADSWNLVRRLAKKRFDGRFEAANWSSLTKAQKIVRADAASALMDDPPAINDPAHRFDADWSWRSRRMRMRLVANALKELPAPSPATAPA